MIEDLKEELSRIVLEIELGDTSAAMRRIARFTVTFDQFLQENKDYIFVYELQDLNSCMGQMLQYMELNDLTSLKEVINDCFIQLMDNWGFNNDKCVHWIGLLSWDVHGSYQKSYH